jgi:hypothetical protein
MINTIQRKSGQGLMAAEYGTPGRRILIAQDWG